MPVIKNNFSFSTGKTLLSLEDFPERAVYSLENRKPPTEAMLLGTHVESAVQFGMDNFICPPEGKTRASKEYKQLVIDNPDKTHINASEYDIISASSEKVRKECPFLTRCEYQKEHWLDLGDFKVHGFTDWENEEFVFDLKRSDITKFFTRTMFDFYYPMQAYIYNKFTGKSFVWIVVDTVAPYSVIAKECDKVLMDIGEEMYYQALELYRRYRGGKLIPEDMELGMTSTPEWAIRKWLG